MILKKGNIIKSESKHDTLVGAKRKRSTLHVTVGETDLWELGDEDISTIADMFVQANEKPREVVVITKMQQLKCPECKNIMAKDYYAKHRK